MSALYIDGISEAETRKEMQIAIDMGMENPDPNAMRVFILTGIKIIPGKPSNQKAPTRLCWLMQYYSIYYDTLRHFPYITKIKSDKNFLRHIHCGQFTIKLFVCQFLHQKLCI